MPPTKDLAKAAACAFVPFAIVFGLFIVLLAMLAGCYPAAKLTSPKNTSEYSLPTNSANALQESAEASTRLPELGIVDGKKTAARMMAEEAGAVERTVIYHVDGTGKVYDITKPGKDAFVGRLTDEQFDKYLAARRKGDTEAMRELAIEATGSTVGPKPLPY